MTERSSHHHFHPNGDWNIQSKYQQVIFQAQVGNRYKPLHLYSMQPTEKQLKKTLAQSLKKFSSSLYTFINGLNLPRLAVTSMMNTLNESLLGTGPLIVVTATVVRSSPASRMTILVFTNPNTNLKEEAKFNQHKLFSSLSE